MAMTATTAPARQLQPSRRGSWWRALVRVRPEHRVEVASGVVIVLVGSLVPFALGNVVLAAGHAADGPLHRWRGVLQHPAGRGGQISFGLGAVFGAAAYSEGMLATVYGLPFWLALVLGVLIGFCSGRHRAAVAAGPELLPGLHHAGGGGGAAGASCSTTTASPMPSRASRWWCPDSSPRPCGGLNWVAIVVIVLAALSFVVHGSIRASRFGRYLKVGADSPEAAASLGIRPGVLRLGAFALARLGASLFGALYVPVTGFISPGAFPFSLSILFYFAVIVGGAGSILGPLLGIYLLYLVPNVLLSSLAQYRLLIYGCTAFVVMLIFPDGIIGFLRSRLARPGRVDEDLGARLADAMLESPRNDGDAGAASEEPLLTVTGAAKSSAVCTRWSTWTYPSTRGASRARGGERLGQDHAAQRHLRSDHAGSRLSDRNWTGYHRIFGHPAGKQRSGTNLPGSESFRGYVTAGEHEP